MTPVPIKTEPIDLYLDPLTGREICAKCFDGDHGDCKAAVHGCRCLHHLKVRKQRIEKDASAQADMSSFGTIEVLP